MEKIYLSNRDINTLLQKLDSVRDGEHSSCTIVKNDVSHPVFPQTLRRISVMAAETEDRYLQGVSPRLHLSRSTLTGLLEHLEKQSDSAIQIDDVGVFPVPDEKYYVDRSTAQYSPIGDVSSEFSRKRGR